MPRQPVPPADPLSEVRAIYAELESRPLERSCIGRSTCCRFLLTGQTPFLTRGEAMVAAGAWKRAGGGPLPRLAADGACPFLKDSRCRIHADRPFACRTHFCEAAGGPWPRGQVRDLIHRLEELDARLGGTGGVRLPVAVAAALDAQATRRAKGNP